MLQALGLLELFAVEVLEENGSGWIAEPVIVGDNLVFGTLSPWQHEVPQIS